MCPRSAAGARRHSTNSTTKSPPLATLRPSTTLVDTASIMSTPDSSARTPVTLTLGDLSGILGEYERQTAEFSPSVNGCRLNLVGGSKVVLTAQTIDLVHTVNSRDNGQCDTAKLTDQTFQSMLDIPSSLYDGIRLKGALWHFDMRPKIRHTGCPIGAEMTARHDDFSGFRQKDKTVNRGLIFEGDMTDWTWGGFEGQSCRSIMFCPDAGAEAEYHTVTETLVLSWKGKLYRSGKDVVQKHTTAATARARKCRMKTARHD